MLFAGWALILAGLLFALFEAHVERQKAWDRPAFTRTWSYRALRRPAAGVLLAGGLACLGLASLRALLAAALALAAGGAWLLRVRSPHHALRRMRRERAALELLHPHAPRGDLTARVLRGWHPEWPRELVERLVADHERLEDLARMVVRMERNL